MMASKLKKQNTKQSAYLNTSAVCHFKIEDAKSLKDFLVEWGMSEGDAKRPPCALFRY